MKAIQNKLGNRLKWWRVASIGSLLVGVSCIMVLFLSPFSPLHAASAPAAWSGNFVAYKTGDVVSYDGKNYTCIQAHTSESNWDPADTAALWMKQTEGTPVAGVSPTSVPTIGITSTPTSIATVGITPTATSVPTVGITPIPTRVLPTVVPTAAPPTGNNPPTPTPIPTDKLIAVSVTFYSDQGFMADGQQTHRGACAVWAKQFPLGTMIKLYDPSDLSQAVYTCTAEDTGTHICQNNIDVALPGQDALAIQLGVKSMKLQVVGFDNVVAQEAIDNHPASQGCELGATH